MSYIKKGIKGLSYILIAGIFANIIGYFSRLILARNLSPTDFGLFYAINTFVMFILLLLQLGFPSAVTKYIAEFKAKKQYANLKFTIKFTNRVRMLLVILLAIILWVLAPWLANNYFKAESAVIILRIFCITIPILTVRKITRNIFKGFQNMAAVAGIMFSEKIFFFIMIILFVFYGFQKSAVLPAAAFLSASLITAVLFLPFVPRIKTCDKPKKGLYKKISKFAFATIILSFEGLLITQVDTLMLTYFRPLSEVGIYNIVIPTVMMLLFISKSMSHLIFPISSELWAKKEKSKLKKGIELAKKWNFILLIIPTILLIVFSKMIITLLFGARYSDGALAMSILAVGVFFLSFTGINKSTIVGVGKPKSASKILLIAIVVNIVLNLILIPLFGINGAAIATSTGYIIMFILLSKSTRRLFKNESAIRN